MSDRVRLAAGALEMELAPAVGGSIAGFRRRVGDAARPVFRESPPDLADAVDAACFPLVPFSNRVREGRFLFRGREVRLRPNLAPHRHPLHGQGWRAAWGVDHADARTAELVFRHAPGEWPWAYEARQRFALDDEGLSVELALTNTGGRDMPAGLGLHPYLPTDPDSVLSAEVTGVWTTEAETLPIALEAPVGRLRLRERRIDCTALDNGYEGWSGEATLRQPRAGHTVRIRAPQARRLQVYAPFEGGVVAVEPVTHANAALNRPESEWPELGLGVLAPGRSMTLSVRFDVLRTPSPVSAVPPAVPLG